MLPLRLWHFHSERVRMVAYIFLQHKTKPVKKSISQTEALNIWQKKTNQREDARSRLLFQLNQDMKEGMNGKQVIYFKIIDLPSFGENTGILDPLLEAAVGKRVPDMALHGR